MALKPNWNHIPCEILVQILSHLPSYDRISACTTCKAWRDVLFYPKFWKKVYLTWLCPIDVKFKQSSFLRDKVSRGVKSAIIEFNFASKECINETLLCLENFGQNVKLEILFIKTRFRQEHTICKTSWELDESCLTRFSKAFKNIAFNCKYLRKITFGALHELIIEAQEAIIILAESNGAVLQELHLSSVNKNSIISDNVFKTFPKLRNLQVLSLNYDPNTLQLVTDLSRSHLVPIRRLHLVFHDNLQQLPRSHLYHTTWDSFHRRHPDCELHITFLKSLRILESDCNPLVFGIPVTHFSAYFCNEVRLSALALELLARISCDKLQSVRLVEKIIPHQRKLFVLSSVGNLDPVLLLAWRCHQLKEITIIGYQYLSDHLVAIGRMQKSLVELNIPETCIEVDEYFDNYIRMITELKYSLGRDWKPIKEDELNPDIYDESESCLDDYLMRILQDSYAF